MTIQASPFPNFYPRPPRGGRQFFRYRFRLTGGISIHALREEGDAPTCLQRCRRCNFYPRPPRGGRLLPYYITSQSSDFYPRPPRGGRLHPSDARARDF